YYGLLPPGRPPGLALPSSLLLHPLRGVSHFCQPYGTGFLGRLQAGVNEACAPGPPGTSLRLGCPSEHPVPTAGIGISAAYPHGRRRFPIASAQPQDQDARAASADPADVE